MIDREAGELRLYVDGAREAVDPSLLEKNIASSRDLSLSLTSANNIFAGSIDEVRLYHGALSDDWIRAEYRNIDDPDRFLEVGAEQTVAD